MEHISTAGAVEFVKNGPENLAANITAHYLIQHKWQVLIIGIDIFGYCCAKWIHHLYSAMQEAVEETN